VAEMTVAPAEGSNPPVVIHAFADGVPVFGKIGLKFQPNADNKMNISVPLLFGNNKIEISGIDRNGNESRRLEFVVRSGTKPKNAKLIGIHIGVSTFKDSTFNLTYAAKDAEDLSKQFNLAGYESEKIVLTNEQVTTENISKLKQKLLATSVHDVVLISVASHGVLDSTLNYYIATHDMDFMNSAVRGIPYSLLEDLLDGIPARRKVLLIDACNSGENLNISEPSEKEKSLQKNITEQGVRARGFKKAQDATSSFTQNNVRRLFELLFPEVRRGTGAIVVSASGAQEFAFESAQWKNGVFTYAVLQGIQTMQADLNKDGKLMMRELKEYVYRKVQDLTNGMQNPTSRLDNIRLDIEVK
ncbi:MAG: caspase domain-containing protein, partial [Candidatus Thermochlorobacter sp.]